MPTIYEQSNAAPSDARSAPRPSAVTARTEVPDLEIRDVTKVFGTFAAVRNISFTAAKGEFISLLGTSGCGKTTTLSMIAGFQTLTSGIIHVRGRRIDHLAPEQRNSGMVFQNYALFPHMTVAENVGFGLRMRRVPKAEMRDRVKAALAMVRMAEFDSRRPSELSGGQQQRVALARALVIEPEILLLDEPFGALDRALRQEMQLELKLLQRSIGITTVFVTHDQEEALSMSDRIAVMSNGQIEQIATPNEVYDRPSTTFVANFMGKSNYFPAEICGVEGDRVVLDTPIGRLTAPCPASGARVGEQVEILVRPEKISRTSQSASTGNNTVTGKIRQIVYQGASTAMHLDLPSGQTFLMSEPNRVANPAAIDQADDVMMVQWPVDETLVFRGGHLQNTVERQSTQENR